MKVSILENEYSHIEVKLASGYIKFYITMSVSKRKVTEYTLKLCIINSSIFNSFQVCNFFYKKEMNRGVYWIARSPFPDILGTLSKKIPTYFIL